MKSPRADDRIEVWADWLISEMDAGMIAFVSIPGLVMGQYSANEERARQILIRVEERLAPRWADNQIQRYKQEQARLEELRRNPPPPPVCQECHRPLDLPAAGEDNA